MSLHGVYDPQNIFAKIIRGEAPYYKIYEDGDMLAFLDLFPQSYGHTLVIPKHVEARSLLEIDAQNLVEVVAVIQHLTRALVEEAQLNGVRVVQFNGAPAGQTVFHIHFHVIPYFGDENLGIHAAEQGDPEALAQLQRRLAQHLQSWLRMGRPGSGVVLRSSDFSEIFCYILPRVRRAAVFR